MWYSLLRSLYKVIRILNSVDETQSVNIEKKAVEQW